jgi:hypothetical protein
MTCEIIRLSHMALEHRPLNYPRLSHVALKFKLGHMAPMLCLNLCHKAIRLGLGHVPSKLGLDLS